MITDKLLATAETKLRIHDIRPTHVRKFILSVFLDAEFALAHADIEREICKKFDRVTIYRTLHTFQAHGLLHPIRDNAGITRFALVLPTESKPEPDEHLHFQCNACGHVYCVPEFNIRDVDLPENFDIHSLILSAEGICKYCKQTNAATIN